MLEKMRKWAELLKAESIPQLSINCVIFGFHEKKLQVIINKIDLGKKTIMVLPGGYVKQTEDLTDAVHRMVKESTGLEKILLKQFEVFGAASRSFGKEFATITESLSDNDKKELEWLSGRFITICYVAFLDYNKTQLKPTQFLEAAEWLPIEKAKLLSLDHAEIVKSARENLAKELPYAPIQSNLLPSKFTLPELHALVEAILDRPVDRPNFRRKVLASKLIVKVGQDDSGVGRPADLYSFKYGKKTNLMDEYKFGF